MPSKKITLTSLAQQMAKGFAKMDARMERGFGSADKKFEAIAEDIGDIREKMATKDQIIALHSQVNSIETEIRDTKRHKLVTRVADLEEEVYGSGASKHPKHQPL